MRISSTVVVAALAASQLGATDCGQVLQDPGFDLWCGSDALCAWTVEYGEIQHAPTWNTADWGVELVGSDVAIDQVSPVDSTDTSCIEISMIADIDEDAEVDLNLDAYADGTIDFSQRIPTSSWAPVSFAIQIDGTWQGMRFEIAKRGPGHAVLARLQAQVSTACNGFSPSFTAPPGPIGAACFPGVEGSGALWCASGQNCVQVGDGSDAIFPSYECAGCGSDADCGSGTVCGIGDPLSPTLAIPIECVAAAATPLGVACSTGEQCASGICAAGVCSACATDADCGSGGTCGVAWTAGFAPLVCDPGEHTGGSGAACGTNADCASGTCAGSALGKCGDGRTCASTYDCPFDDATSDSPLQNGTCTFLGVTGGTCL